MIKRTVEISTGPTYLSVKDEQLVVTREREVVGTIPCEDVGLLIVEHPAVTYTHGVLTTLMRHGAVIIACGPDHHPVGYVWPVEANTLHTERLRLQVEMSRPVGKRVWQQIVRAKIRAQAANLLKCHHAALPLPSGERAGVRETTADAAAPAACRKLMKLADEVRSGDPSNVEAQAAKVYWKALFPTTCVSEPGAPATGLSEHGVPARREHDPSEPGAQATGGASPLNKGGQDGGSFHRDPDGPPPNNLLNYGYMVVRAAVARAICAAGLHPSIGFHHRNRYNPFCLADDLVEPLRPLVDARVRALVSRGQLEIDKYAKTELLGILTETVMLGGESGPLLVALSKMMASLVRVLEGGEKRLEIPTSCT